MSGEYPDDVTPSKIDGSALKVWRLAECWTQCKIYYTRADAAKLNDVLEVIWFELYADATDEEINKVEKINREINKSRRQRNPGKIWHFVKEKWKFLTKIEKHQGLGKRYRSALEDALE